MILYWVLTAVVAFEMAAWFRLDLLRIEYVRVVMTHLGYPSYMSSIVGVWKCPCALALLAPRFPRLKEWAYAGAFFDHSGATASHVLAGDGPGRWAAPLVFAALALASWALRPPSRRLQKAGAPVQVHTLEWVVALLAAILMVIVSLTFLPKGPPQGY